VSQNVLDLIDGVIDEYYTPADAMRWNPDAPDPTSSEQASGGPIAPELWRRVAILDEREHWVDLTPFVASVDIELTDWQRDILERLPTGSITVSFDHSASRFTPHRFVDYRPLCAHHYRLWSQRERQRTARLSRMHAAYRRRRS
jgi:hypothetical protein